MTEIKGLEIKLGSSGVEIRAQLSKRHNLVEYTIPDNKSVPIFHAPWSQFSNAELQDEQHQIAVEIVRRAVVHEELVKELARIQKHLDEWMDTCSKKDRTLNTTFEMWKADRAKAGLPEDFSDIKSWPPEMMSDYR